MLAATKNKVMEAVLTSLTDQQRVDTLNNLYKKGLSTPKENLAFSADKLVYLKPFISRLQSNGPTQDLNTRMMVRSVVDELLSDILEEIEATCVRCNEKVSDKIAMEYGLGMLVNDYDNDFYLNNKVA